jgi:glutathione S-transferase
MTIQLHCFGESGNAYKAALTLELAGLDWEPVKVDFFAGATRDPNWRAENNVMGEAPILIAPKITLTQSGAIQQWIVDQTGKLGGAPEDKYEVLRWVLFDNHKMSSQAGVTPQSGRDRLHAGPLQSGI